MHLKMEESAPGALVLSCRYYSTLASIKDKFLLILHLQPFVVIQYDRSSISATNLI